MPQSLNRFAYVLNNPLKHIDPSGHCIPGDTCKEPKPPKKKSTPLPPTSTPTSTPTATPAAAPTSGANGWESMEWQIMKSPVGVDLLSHVPGDTFVADHWIANLLGGAAQPFGHNVYFPYGFDPTKGALDPGEVGTLAHELNHTIQRDHGRMLISSQYAELESSIVGYSVAYDLSGNNWYKDTLRTLTGPLDQAYKWLREHNENWSENTVGSGKWNETLKDLGYSQGAIDHIEDIIK